MALGGNGQRRESRKVIFYGCVILNYSILHVFQLGVVMLFWCISGIYMRNNLRKKSVSFFDLPSRARFLFGSAFSHFVTDPGFGEVVNGLGCPCLARFK